MDRAAIIPRVEAALERARLRGMAVRAICLAPADYDALAWAVRRPHKGPRPVAEFRGCEVRIAKRSAVWSRQGCSVTVPAKLSRRVAG